MTATRWRSQLASYAALRLLSGFLSFALFALIVRWLPDREAKPLVDFLFVTGFFLSALRLLATQTAGLVGSERRTQKLRRVFHAYGYVLWASLVLAPTACAVLADPAIAAAGLVAVALVVLLWGLDIDLLRAALGRDMLIARATAVGALTALLCLVLWPDRHGALLALLLQWLPLCALQARLAWRLRRRLHRSFRAASRGGASGIVAMTGVALFDGAVLNAPFLLGAWVASGVGVSIGVVTRIFSSALVLQPLVMHWSNGSLLSSLGVRWGMPPSRLFWLLSVGSSTAAALAFAGCYALLAGYLPSLSELLATFILLVGYCTFAAISRFAASRAVQAELALKSRPARSFWLPFWPPLWLQLAALALLNALGLTWTVTGSEPVLATAALQAFSLVAGGVLVARPWQRSGRL